MVDQKNRKETFRVSGSMLIAKVKELINEGNVRKIIIRDKNDKEIAEFPVTIGVAAAVFAPVLAAIGAIAALVTECSITVVRDVPDTPTEVEKTEE